MTLYFVPWAAIAAELTDDYEDRTSVMAYRYALGWLIAVCFPLFIFTFVMPGTEAFPVGQLNPEGYPVLAMCAGLLLTGGALVNHVAYKEGNPLSAATYGSPNPIQFFDDSDRVVASTKEPTICAALYHRSGFFGNFRHDDKSWHLHDHVFLGVRDRGPPLVRLLCYRRYPSFSDGRLSSAELGQKRHPDYCCGSECSGRCIPSQSALSGCASRQW